MSRYFDLVYFFNIKTKVISDHIYNPSLEGYKTTWFLLKK